MVCHKLLSKEAKKIEEKEETKTIKILCKSGGVSYCMV